MLLNASVLNAEAINAPSGAARTFLRGSTGMDAQAERRLGILSASLAAISGMTPVSTVAGTIKADLFARSLIFPFPTYAIALTRADIVPETGLMAILTPLIKGTAVLSTFSSLEGVFSHWPVVPMGGEAQAEASGGYVLGTMRATLAGESYVGIRTGGRVMGAAALTLSTGATIQGRSKLSGRARPAASLSMTPKANFSILVSPALLAQAGIAPTPSAYWNSPAASEQGAGSILAAPTALMSALGGIHGAGTSSALATVLWKGHGSLQDGSALTISPAVVKDSLGTELSTRAILVVFSGIIFFGQETTIYLDQDATDIQYSPDETVIYFSEDATTIYLQ